MASPFPGMDPYLESHWGDVHQRLITYASDQLQQVLPADLRARVEERVFVEPLHGPGRPLYPDLRIVEKRRGRKPTAGSAAAAVLEEPLLIHLPEPATEGLINIVEVGPGRRVVTVVEVLSLSNKLPGESQQKYLQKRQELKKGNVSLVEIDLLRAGQRLLPCPLEQLPPAYRTVYQVWVNRAWQPEAVAVYRVPLRERLPRIRIPLREHEAEVPLDLQALVDQCYRNGGYDDDIDYREEPDPPLASADARWAAALLRKMGRRSRRSSGGSGRRRRRGNGPSRTT